MNKNDLHIKNLESEIERLRSEVLKYKFDNLTRLPMRHDFMVRVDNATDELIMFGKHFTLAMIDINNLKKINTEYGYIYGDSYIKRVADNLIKVFHDCNIYRIGGDEFCLIKIGHRDNDVKERLETISDIEFGLLNTDELSSPNINTKELITIADNIIKKKKG